MNVYKAMYLRLFGRTADAIELLERGEAQAAAELLKSAQCETEGLYISRGDEPAK